MSLIHTQYQAATLNEITRNIIISQAAEQTRIILKECEKRAKDGFFTFDINVSSLTVEVIKCVQFALEQYGFRCVREAFELYVSWRDAFIENNN